MIEPTKVNIGDKLNHNKHGEITVLGIKPHCGDYMIICDIYNWVYLKNCNNLRKNV